MVAVVAIRTHGIVISGGAPATFTQVTDHRTGHWRVSFQSGPLLDVSGFDGTPWDARSGIVTQADLPGIVADAVTEAYMARDGWWNANDAATMTVIGVQNASGGPADVIRVEPRGGSAVDAWLDRSTHLLVRTVQHTDAGDVTTDYSDYRDADRVKLAFRQVSVDATNARTETTVDSANVTATVAAADLQRPAPSVHAAFDGPSPAIVPFVFTQGDTGQVVVSATVDRKPASLIFDSGGANYLVPDAARRLALTTGGGTDISGVGNASQAASFASVAVIGVGSSQLRDQSAIVAPLPYIVQHPRMGLTVDGLLGFETLASFRTTLDYGARTLTLAPFDSPPPRGVTVPFVTEGAHAYIPVTVDGATGLFGLDTGDSGGVTVFRRFASAHGIFTGPGLQYVAAGGVGGTLGYALYRGSAMTIAGTTLDRPLVIVTDAAAGAFASRAIAGNIGARVLQRFRVTFDYRAHTVTFEPNARVHEPFEGDRTGFSLTQQDPDAFVVLSVVPDSPAAAAGIRPGDRIVDIDGRSVAGEHLGIGDLRPILDKRTADLPLVIRRGTSQTRVVLHPRALL